MTRVLIVEQSAEARELLTYILGSDPQMLIVGCAATGAEALRLNAQHKPDVITMALRLADMDGIEATRAIMQTCPAPIVMVSGDEPEDGAARAIEAGALVLVRRPSGLGSENFHAASNALLRAVKSMAEVKVVRRWSRLGRSSPPAETPPPAARIVAAPKLVAIGTSTGGPAALREILEQMPRDYPLPIAIVQHMAFGFVGGYASWLAAATGFPVKIAEHGMVLAPGQAYLAPDDFQMGVRRDLSIDLARAPAEHGMCPSVSYLFRSIPPELRAHTVAVLLTGMGRDGAVELKALKDGGAVTIVQDRATSAVHGMPGEAIRLDAAMMIMSAREIGQVLAALGRQQSGKYRVEN